jgi:hypothetical protein
MKKTRGKVPAGPKAQPGKAGHAASSRKQPKAAGIDPGNPHWGIKNTTRKHSSAITQPSGRNVPTGQEQLTKNVKRQAY